MCANCDDPICFACSVLTSPNSKNRVREKTNFARRFKLIWVVQSQREKYFACAVGQIKSTNSRVPSRKRGVRVVTNVGYGMRWTQWRRKTSGANADGKAVWSWRPDAGVKLAGSDLQVTVAKEPGHRGEHGISRKTIAQETPDCSVNLW
jgi:hypothetical protein